MRVTGAADPTTPVAETLEGKLPAEKDRDRSGSRLQFLRQPDRSGHRLCKGDLSSGYVAKRMEVGAVMGAAPRKNVMRLTSDPGDHDPF